MKTGLKILTGAVVIAIIAGFLVYKFVYNKPHTDYEKATPDYTLSAQELYQQCKTNDTTIIKKYSGKVVQINGNLTRVETVDTLTICIFKFEEGLFGDQGVRVTMLKDQVEKVKKLNPGNSVTIKGFCSGFNDPDVIIEKGSVVE